MEAGNPVEDNLPVQGELEPASDVSPEMASSAGAEEDETFFAKSPDVEVPEQRVDTQPASEIRPARVVAPRPVRDEMPAEPRRLLQPAHPDSVRKAIDDVMGVISSLRESLDQMDEVLEILEEAERQKTADERDIEALRQQLRRFQKPVDEIPRVRPPLPPPVVSGGGNRDRDQRPPREQRDQRDPREQRGPQRGNRDQRPYPQQRNPRPPQNPQGAARSPGNPSPEVTNPISAQPSPAPEPPPSDGTDAGGPS